jgi:hypothetical protein
MEIVDENSSSLPEGAYLELGRLIVGENVMVNGQRVIQPPAIPMDFTLMQKINMLSDIFRCKVRLVQVQKNRDSADGGELSSLLQSITMRKMDGDYNWMPAEIKCSIDSIASMTESQLYHTVLRYIDPNNTRAVYTYNVYLHHLDVICKYMPSV